MLVCFMATLLNSGCEKADLQKSLTKDGAITPRTTCGNCPVNYCCCAVERLDNNIDLELCGVYSFDTSPTPCSDTWGNCTISGYLLPISLMGSGDYEIFCAAASSAFRVKSSITGTVRVTCQYGQVSPVSTDLTFPGTSYVYINGSCEVSQHCPL